MPRRTPTPRRQATPEEIARNNVRSSYGTATSEPVRNIEIDLALAAMCKHQRPGECFSGRDIARVTGLSHGGPRAIELSALKKLRFAARHLHREIAA